MAVGEQIEDTLYSEESVWVLLLTDAFKENWQVVMVIQRHDVNLPLNLVLRPVLNANRQVSSIIETAEFRWSHLPSSDGSGHWLRWSCLLWGFGGRERLTTNSLAFLES